MQNLGLLFSLFFFVFSPSELCFPRRNSPVIQDVLSNRISIRDHQFVDRYGRVRIFHGWNSVLKGHPWYDSQMLNDTRLDLFKAWGFNVVRLGTMWAGVEPSEQLYNQTYIATLRTIVEKLKQRGIYVLMDMHQDVISSKYRNYDGVPRWLIDSFPPARHAYPWPLAHAPPPEQWGAGYLTEGVGHAFQCLYDNVVNATVKMGRFWQKVAREFGSIDTILGYELINEPWAGDIYENPNLLLPRVAGKTNLIRLYDSLNKAIRQVDDETLIFYEPTTWGVFAGNNGSYLGTGFDRVPGGPVYNNRSVLSYHYYCWLLSANASRPYPVLERFGCTVLSEGVFNNVVQDVKRTGGGSMLTEFGVCAPDGHNTSIDTIECNRVMSEADRALQSWTYWDSNFFHSNGSVITNTAKGFSRTYARAIAGQPVEMYFDSTTGEFRLRYVLNRAIQAPTEVYTPPLHYPNGKVVQVSKGLEWREDNVTNLIFIEPSKQHENMSLGTVDITISPKRAVVRRESNGQFQWL